MACILNIYYFIHLFNQCCTLTLISHLLSYTNTWTNTCTFDQKVPLVKRSEMDQPFMITIHRKKCCGTAFLNPGPLVAHCINQVPEFLNFKTHQVQHKFVELCEPKLLYPFLCLLLFAMYIQCMLDLGNLLVQTFWLPKSNSYLNWILGLGNFCYLNRIHVLKN